MTANPTRTRARPGDWVEVHQIGGGAPRRGQVLEVLGQPGHEHYRVRWDEEHESIHFPADGTVVLREAGRRKLEARRGRSPTSCSSDTSAMRS
jgi:hypothetical protein